MSIRSSCLPGYDAEEDPDFAAPLPENRNASSEEAGAGLWSLKR